MMSFFCKTVIYFLINNFKNWLLIIYKEKASRTKIIAFKKRNKTYIFIFFDMTIRLLI